MHASESSVCKALVQSKHRQHGLGTTSGGAAHHGDSTRTARALAMPKPTIAKKASSSWPSSYTKLGFVAFTGARQEVFLNRRRGLPRGEWTDDPVLRRAKFCNIDRRDDAVTAELLEQLSANPSWKLRERALLAIALRFSGSRRGEAASLAALVEAGRQAKGAASTRTPLSRAFDANEVRCGAGTYQLSLNRRQVASVIEQTASAVVERVRGAAGPFVDVREASDFVAERMTVGKRPQFSANEAAKDFAYVEGLMLPQSSGHRCRLGPGAKKGLALVRASDEGAALLAGGVGADFVKSEDEGDAEAAAAAAAVDRLRRALRRVPSLAWVEAIDVEQALCEFSKYEAYCSHGVSAAKTFTPAAEK